MLDQYGNIVGVVTSKLDAIAALKITGDIPQNVNFAIKSSVLANFLESIGVEFDQSVSKKILTTEDVAEKAKALAFKIECN